MREVTPRPVMPLSTCMEITSSDQLCTPCNSTPWSRVTLREECGNDQQERGKGAMCGINMAHLSLSQDIKDTSEVARYRDKLF
jgi:hypothetical protein